MNSNIELLLIEIYAEFAMSCLDRFLHAYATFKVHFVYILSKNASNVFDKYLVLYVL